MAEKDTKQRVQVRHVCLGDGIPKICIPLTGQNQAEVLDNAKAAKEAGADLAEFRVDYLQNLFLAGQKDGYTGAELEKAAEPFTETERCSSRSLNRELLGALLAELRKILSEMPLLFTFRTASEGGEQKASLPLYMELNRFAIESGKIDLLDVEWMQGKEVSDVLIQEAKKCGVKVILSNHDFAKTPSSDEIRARIRCMQARGADLAKMAVMPQTKADVLRFMTVTEQLSEELKCPLISMSMGKLGALSRIAGGLTGSCLTFGTAGKASAPGQFDAKALRKVLEMLQ